MGKEVITNTNSAFVFVNSPSPKGPEQRLQTLLWLDRGKSVVQIKPGYLMKSYG
jgi:hypothetical protein